MLEKKLAPAHDILVHSEHTQKPPLTLCRPENPRLVLLQTVKTQMKYYIRRHFMMVNTIC